MRAVVQTLAVCLTIGSNAWASSATFAADDVDFKGKQVTIQIGYGVGGSYDVYGRLAARYFGKYLPGKVWAVAGMAVMAQRAGIGAGPATGSAVILQVLAIGTGAAVAALTGWSALHAAYPGAGLGLALLLTVAVAGVGLLLWPGFLTRVLRVAAPDAGPVAPPVGAVVFGIAANAVAWLGYGVALWLLARGLLPRAGLGLLPAVAVFTASYLAGFLALFAPGGIGVREGVFILMLQGPIGIGAATALAIASRLLLTVTELGAAVPFLLFPRESPRVAG